MGSLYNKGEGGNPFERAGQQQPFSRPDRTMGGFLNRPFNGQGGGWGDMNWGKLSSALAGSPQMGARWQEGMSRPGGAMQPGTPPQASTGPVAGLSPEQPMRTQGPGTGSAPPMQPQPPQQQPEVLRTQGPGQGMAPPAQPQQQPWLPDNSINGGEWWKSNPAYGGAPVPYPGTTQVPKQPVMQPAQQQTPWAKGAYRG